MTEASIRIVGGHLPGRTVGPHTNLHLGIQRGREVIDVAPADSSRVEFRIPVEVRTDPDGRPDFFGPFAQGKRAARFVYLNWVNVADDGELVPVGRVKLLLSGLPPKVIGALSGGGAVRADVDLTDARGGPIYASVTSPDVEWTVED